MDCAADSVTVQIIEAKLHLDQSVGFSL